MSTFRLRKVPRNGFGKAKTENTGGRTYFFFRNKKMGACEGADFPLCGKSRVRKALPVTPQGLGKR